MKPVFLFTIILAAAALSAQTKKSFDIVTYAAPKGWTEDAKENMVSYSIVDKKNNRWCQVGIIKSTVSKGSIEADFTSEWQELVVKSYQPSTAPQVNEVQEADGWKIKAGGAKFNFNNSDALALLTTISGYGRCVSVVASTNHQDYTKDIEALLASIDLIKPSTNTLSQNGVSDAKSVIGSWGANASDQSSYRVNNGVMNYISRQYTFAADGTYSFTSKTFDPLMDKILLGKETGVYQVSGNSLSITPKKSVLEAWSKKDGTDKWGNLISTQNMPLEKINYLFTKHYFSGTQLWALVLQYTAATKRDGPYSGNTSFSNAWYYNPISSNNPIIELPAGQKTAAAAIKNEPVQPTVSNNNSGIKFTTTNWDDGWSSTRKEDWVELTKNDLRILLHYKHPEADAYNSVLMDAEKNAWNILVAPRYSSAANMHFKPHSSWQSIEFAEADMTEKATGKNVYVVFFKKHYSNGAGTHMEFISPSRAAFENEFGKYNEEESWDKVEKMAGYNKFAVAASDFTGEWTNNFSGMTQYVNAYTGASAGADTHSSSQKFEFGPGSSYKWQISMASGFVGNIKFQGAKSSGNFTVPNNWQVKFSDLEGKPKLYNAYFSFVRGARLLWLEDSAYPSGYTSFGKMP